MRKLDFTQFDGDANKVFGVVWMAFRASYPRKAAGYEQMKLCNRIGERLEKISKPAGTGADPGDRELVDGKALLLEPMEADKLLSMLKDEQIGWLHTIGPTVERAIEALGNAPAVEVEEKKSKGKAAS